MARKAPCVESKHRLLMSFQGFWADIHNSIRIGQGGFLPRVQIEFHTFAFLNINVTHYAMMRVGAAGEIEDRCAQNSIPEPDFGSKLGIWRPVKSRKHPIAFDYFIPTEGRCAVWHLRELSLVDRLHGVYRRCFAEMLGHD